MGYNTRQALKGTTRIIQTMVANKWSYKCALPSSFLFLRAFFTL